MIDLLITAAASALLFPLAVFTAGILRILLGLAFVLFLPGYSLVSALFPGKGRISTAERVALSFGLSVAVIPLIGLALNFTPSGITLVPVLGSILAFILVASSVAWYRRRKLSPDERFGLSNAGSLTSLVGNFSQKSRLDKVLNGALAAGFVAAVITLGFFVSNPQHGERFSEFYILGAGGKADNYPTTLEVGQTGTVTAGITNYEQETATYVVEINISGMPAARYGPVTLEAGQIWQQQLSFTPESAGVNQKVEFDLYINDSADVYLSTHIWIDVTATGTA